MCLKNWPTIVGQFFQRETTYLEKIKISFTIKSLKSGPRLGYVLGGIVLYILR